MAKKAALPEHMTYAEIIRIRMKTGDNQTRRPVTTRQLANHLGVTYEHVRMILLGKPAMSRELNDSLCEFMGLDKDQMWFKLQSEKFTKRLGIDPALQTPVNSVRLAQLWPLLTEEQRATIERLAEVLAVQSKATSKALA